MKLCGLAECRLLRSGAILPAQPAAAAGSFVAVLPARPETAAAVLAPVDAAAADAEHFAAATTAAAAAAAAAADSERFAAAAADADSKRFAAADSKRFDAAAAAAAADQACERLRLLEPDPEGENSFLGSVPEASKEQPSVLDDEKSSERLNV